MADFKVSLNKISNKIYFIHKYKANKKGHISFLLIINFQLSKASILVLQVLVTSNNREQKIIYGPIF